MKIVFFSISFVILVIGICGSPLLTRLYFLHGGKRLWFSSWLQTGAFPVILVPLLVAYTRRRRRSTGTKLFFMEPRLLAVSSVVGIPSGLCSYLSVYGFSLLPVSTASLILASQLVFTAVFAFFLVKQKFTAYSINAVILLTLASAVLAMHMSGDRPAGESSKAYLEGFLMTLGTAVMFGLFLPLVELIYKKANQTVTLTLVLEMQLVISLVATALCTVCMLINKDFQAIAREAKSYELGETNYYIVVVSLAIVCQCYTFGVFGIIFSSSSLVSGIVVAALLPATEILAVIIYHEKFQVEKGISLFLSMWGFISYFYGEFKYNISSSNNNDDNEPKTEVALVAP